MTSQQSTARRSRRIHAEGITSDPDAKVADRPLAHTSQISPEMLAACVVMSFSRGGAGNPDMDIGVEVMEELQPLLGKLASGDMVGIERMLFCQAIGLQTIFTRLSALAIQEPLGSAKMQSSMSLALQAQGAGRATLEVLAHIKAGTTKAPVQDLAAGTHNQECRSESAAAGRHAAPRPDNQRGS